MAASEESQYLSGGVRMRRLPVCEGSGPHPGGLKRLLLPQGELASFYDGDEPVHYMAFLELREGTVRGQHYHERKDETFYMIAGECVLIVEDRESKLRHELTMKAGDLVRIAPGVAHAIRVIERGQAVEFSHTRFDAADTHRYSLAG